MPRNLRKIDLLAITLIVGAFVLLAELKSHRPKRWYWLQTDMSDHLGAEYNNIAKSIAGGIGYSNPFPKPTGPTAWMPPVLPWTLAAVHWAFPGTDSPRHFMLSLSAIAVWFTGLIVIDQATVMRLRSFGYAMFSIGVAGNFHELFQKTHDPGLLLILVGIIYVGARTVGETTPPLRIILWGFFGGFCALCSPILGATWAAICLYRLWPIGKAAANPILDAVAHPIRFHNARLRRLLISAFVSMIVITPWTIRNRVVLKAWIPIKSNGMYELWQSQSVDADGVLDLTSFTDHPWNETSSQLPAIQETGEIAFISEKGEQAIDAICREPFSYAKRVANRFVAATLWYVPFSNYHRQRCFGVPFTMKRLIHPLPLISLVLVLVFGIRNADPSDLKLVSLICVAYLTPYLLITFYERYAIPILGMQMLIVLYGVASSTSRLSRP
jgi:hypothetical protein